MIRRNVRTAALAAALALSAFAASSPASAAGDPLEPLRAKIERQDDLASRGRFDELLKESEAAARDGTGPTLYLLGRALGNVGLVRRAEGKTKESAELLERARRCFEQALEAEALVYAPALLGLARVDRHNGELDLAISELERAIKLEPAFKAAAVELAQTYAEKGRHAEAELTLRKVIEQRPKDTDLRVVFGLLKLGRKSYGEAEAEFRLALQLDPQHTGARKGLAACLMYQENLKESAEHFERYRLQVPQDDEPYRALFMIYRRQGDRTNACRVLEDLRKAMPGTEAGVWAGRVLEQVTKDEAWAGGEELTPGGIVKRLKDKDPTVQLAALADMRKFEWSALPGEVYQLLAPDLGRPDVRKAAVAVIAAQKDPRTLTLLEVLLFHTKERDPDIGVRREAIAAIAALPTPGVVPLLYMALDDSDEQIRETAVAGLTTVTGKSFRKDPAAKPDAAAWGAERAEWRTWWMGDGTLAKRDAIEALGKLFDPIRRGRRRLAVYALLCMDDANPRTWRAGYDVFRALAGVDFGYLNGEADAKARQDVVNQCRAWFAVDANREDT